MELWAAFLLGLVGSLHCAGMCGPLALALPRTGRTTLGLCIGRFGYNLGRISAYSLLGIAFGFLGQSMALAGLQRWTSLAAGTVILLALWPAARYRFALPAIQAVAWIKAGLSVLFKQRSVPALYLLGVLNGFLPCGLVYVACAGAVALGSLVSGVAYMLAFGLGTVPLMLGIGLFGHNVQQVVRNRFQKLIPICLLVLGLVLILRGLGLGIPYLSPDLSAAPAAPSCH